MVSKRPIYEVTPVRQAWVQKILHTVGHGTEAQVLCEWAGMRESTKRTSGKATLLLWKESVEKYGFYHVNSWWDNLQEIAYLTFTLKSRSQKGHQFFPRHLIVPNIKFVLPIVFFMEQKQILWWWWRKLTETKSPLDQGDRIIWLWFCLTA